MVVLEIKKVMLDLRQSEEYGEYMRSQGWTVELGGEVQVFIKKLPLLPISVMKIQRFAKDLDWKEVSRLKRKYRVIYTVLEPASNFQFSIFNFQKNGFKLAKNSYLPTKTLMVDLKKSEERLWKELSKDARQKLNKFSIFNSQFSNKEQVSKNQLQNFWEEWKKAGKGYVPSYKSLLDLKKSFGMKCWVIVALTPSRAEVLLPLDKGRQDGKLLAGMVVLVAGKTAYYYFAWTNEEGRRMGVQYKLVWEGIMRAKKKKLAWWDFEGIEDDRFPRKTWQGFSLFKKKFGGEEISFPGCWEKWC